MSSSPDEPSGRGPLGGQSSRRHTAEMVLYRRNRVPGATYFFTVALRDRTSRLLTERHADFREAYRAARIRRLFETVAIVVLPEHLHAIWRLPEGDADYSG